MSTLTDTLLPYTPLFRALPSNMDCVPGLSFHGSRPVETFAYRFTLKQAGTYWYHGHSSLQEAKGVYGAIVIEPDEPDPVAADRDYVLLLSDWSDEDPHASVRQLTIQPDYYNRYKIGRASSRESGCQSV